MTIRRIVPNTRASEPKNSRKFYTEFLDLEVAMERDEIITFVSPGNPTAQINVIRNNKSKVPHPDVSIEVADVDDTHDKAVARGLEIVYPLTDESWGVRRFFAADPNGMIINVLSHI